MQTLKVEKANDLNLSMLTNDFFYWNFKFNHSKKGQCNPGVCLSWYKWHCLSGAKFKRKLTLVKGKMHCFTTFDNSLKILK